MLAPPSSMAIVLGMLSAVAAAARLESRAIQVAAFCQTQFSWMDNQNSESPCLVNANLNALCNAGSWDIPSITNGSRYLNPGNPPGTQSFCTCSWVAYNTIGACAACQGSSTIAIWDDYISGCSGLLSNSYFPTNITLPSSTSIPFWAVQNPTTWPNRQFNFASAKEIQSQGHADIVPTAPGANKKKAPIGAIVGGVIGGIAIIIIAVLIALYMMRQKKANAKAAVSTHGHLRSTSDVSSKTGFMSSSGYATLTSASPMFTGAPTSPTIRTNPGSSIRSLPFNSVIGSTIPPTVSPPPPPLPHSSSSPPAPPGPVNREDIIVPFTVRPSTPDRDRKHPNGPFQIYDPPNALPLPNNSASNVNVNLMRMDVPPSTPVQQRGRINPPAYTESSPVAGPATPTSSSSRQPGMGGRPHTKMGSADTHDSSSLAGGLAGVIPPVRYPGGHVPASSPPSVLMTSPSELTRDNTLTTNYSRGEGGSVPVGHGRTVARSPDEKTDTRASTNINPRDLA